MCFLSSLHAAVIVTTSCSKPPINILPTITLGSAVSYITFMTVPIWKKEIESLSLVLFEQFQAKSRRNSLNSFIIFELSNGRDANVWHSIWSQLTLAIRKNVVIFQDMSKVAQIFENKIFLFKHLNNSSVSKKRT